MLELAPPGVDELMALGDVVDLLGERAYNVLVLDTAPTGHLLRLLEMPETALRWAHELLRLLLRYREVVGLGKTAERLLRFSRATRELRERLADPAHTALLVVALPEALSVPETERLLARATTLEMVPAALLVNRLLTPAKRVRDEGEEHALGLLRLPSAPPAAGAPLWREGPRGADALLRFGRSWRTVHPT
jgi:arsenite-transporting ATPase